MQCKILFFAIFLLIANDIDAQDADSSSLEIVFESENTTCIMYQECQVNLLVKKPIKVNTNHFQSTSGSVFVVDSLDECINELTCFKFKKNDSINPEEYQVYKVKISSVVFGGAYLNVFGENLKTNYQHLIIITEPRRLFDIIFDVFVWVFQVVVSMVMGCLLDYETLKKIIKMPYPVLIGLSSQYILMPLLAYFFVSVFDLHPAEALALFIYGTCPGGAASNNWTILFDGDIDLSAIMTFCSTLMAFVAMPAWVYTLGKQFSVKANIKIPYLMLFINIFVTVGPCLIGFFLAHFVPKVKNFANKFAKPFTLVFMFTFLTLVILTKSYVFKVMKWYHFIAGPLLPWSGYIVGGLCAAIFGLSFKKIKTISIETGIQNVGIAFLIVMTNFPSPDRETAYLPLISVAFLTIIPLYLVYATLKAFEGIKFLINKCTNKQRSNKNEENSTVEEGREMLPIEAKINN